MELQGALSDLTSANLALFAISYDAVPVLAAFAEKRGITYPLLADEGAMEIARLGLTNRHLDAQARFFGREPQDFQRGVPYPGYFVLDERGVVERKVFEQSYRVRPSTGTLLDNVLGRAPADLGEPAAVDDAAHDVRVELRLSDPTYRPYQQLHLIATLVVPPGLHVYGRPIPEGYVPLTVELEPFDGLIVEEAHYPTPRSLRVEGLDESFVGYEGRVSVTLPFAIESSGQPVELPVRVSYQACTDRVCYPPATARATLALDGRDLVRD